MALTVSTGPCQAPVPNVGGSSLAGATSTLTEPGVLARHLDDNDHLHTQDTTARS